MIGAGIRAASSRNGVLSSRRRRAGSSCSGRDGCEGQFAYPVRTRTSQKTPRTKPRAAQSTRTGPPS